MISAAVIAEALQARPTGKNRWRARCPAHADQHPSLDISIGHTGAALVKCWSGCTQADVISALRARGLWHTSERDERAPASMTRSSREPPAPPDAVWHQRELDRLLADAETYAGDATYIVAGELLENAAYISYHAVARIAETLSGTSDTLARHVSQWMNDRYPDALFAERPPDLAPPA